MHNQELQELKERWTKTLRQKVTYKHDERKNGITVFYPDIDDICDEMEASFTGLDIN